MLERVTVVTVVTALRLEEYASQEEGGWVLLDKVAAAGGGA